MIKKPLTVTYLLLGIILFAVFMFFQKDTSRKLCIRDQNEFRSDGYSGSISEIFLDEKNHLAMTFIISLNDSSYTKWLFGIRSMRELYETADIGDSIYKAIGDDHIYLYKHGDSTKFYVDLECED